MNLNAEPNQIWEENFNFDCIEMFEQMKLEERNKINQIVFTRTVSKRLELNSPQFFENMIKVIKLFPNSRKLYIANYVYLMDKHIVELGMHKTN